MRSLIRDLLPYGVVVRTAIRRHERELARARHERSAQLRPVLERVSTMLPRLNMGCGSHQEPGWINVDADANAPLVLRLTEGEPLPFEDDSLEVVFSEHFLEHLTFDEGCWFFREAHRVLRPSGIFRVCCPDLDSIAQMAVADDDSWKPLARIYESTGAFPAGALTDDEAGGRERTINWTFYGYGHRHLWSLRQLEHELHRAGFTGPVRRCAFGESGLPDAAIEIRREEAFYSIIAETVRT